MKSKNFIKNKINCYLRKDNGFSLVEMLMVVLIIGIVSTAVSALYISSLRSQKDLLNKANLETNLRTAIYSISKDLREATNVTIAENSKIKFDIGTETIEYELVTSNGTYKLNKKITEGGSTITKFIMEDIIDNNIFSYYLESGQTALSVPLSSHLSDFKLVNLNFTVNKEPSVAAKAINLSTMVHLRNR